MPAARPAAPLSRKENPMIYPAPSRPGRQSPPSRQSTRQLHRRQMDRRRSRAAISTIPRPSPASCFARSARSSAEDIELALDAAHAAADNGAAPPVAERANDPEPHRRPHRGEPRAAGLRRDLDNGKPIRETLAADMPLAIDHFRYFAGCIRAQEGALPRSTTTPSPTTSTSRWAWSARSSRGTSPS